MIVTNHAVKRWRERTGATYSDDKVRKKLEELVTQGREVQLKEEFRLHNLLLHKCEPTKYIYSGGFIMVVVEDVMKTVLTNATKRWEI